MSNDCNEIGMAGLGAARLLGVKRFRKPNKPKDSEYVIWIWAKAGQVTAGDYYRGQARDAAKNYEPITDCKPTHWMPWPDNWPDA